MNFNQCTTLFICFFACLLTFFACNRSPQKLDTTSTALETKDAQSQPNAHAHDASNDAAKNDAAKNDAAQNDAAQNDDSSAIESFQRLKQKVTLREGQKFIDLNQKTTVFLKSDEPGNAPMSCDAFVAGLDREDQFVAEEHYAVCPDQRVYILDVLYDEYVEVM